MFDDAWRCMKYRFYDPKLHGTDWDAMRAKYKPLVAYVADRHELMNVINEMIGELNASHTGASAGRERGPARPGSVMTRHLGLDLQADAASGRYQVKHVYEDGPADKDWIKVEKGNYLIAIDGKPLKAGDDYNAFLGRRLNRKVELTVNSKPGPEGAWKVKYEPISMTAFNNLRYERWVKERRRAGRQAFGRPGRLPAHQGHGSTVAGKFKKDLGEFRHKEGLVIDERWNGGGNIEQELLAILVQRPYEVWQPRGVEPTERPFTGYFGPKVVLQNWRSASNAEMFPAGFRASGPRQGDRHADHGGRDRHGQLFLDRRLIHPHPGRRRLPRRFGADQHGKPRRPARRLRRKHPGRQPRRPRPPARNGRTRGHEGTETCRLGGQERQGMTVSQYGDKVTTINRRAPLLTGGVRFPTPTLPAGDDPVGDGITGKRDKIRGFPTTLVIDQEGKVAGSVNVA